MKHGITFQLSNHLINAYEWYALCQRPWPRPFWPWLNEWPHEWMMDELIKANGEIVYLFGYCAVVHSSPVWKACSVLSLACLDPKLLSTLSMSIRCGCSCWCVRMPRHVIHSFATVMPPKHNLSGLGDLAGGSQTARQTGNRYKPHPHPPKILFGHLTH